VADKKTAALELNEDPDASLLMPVQNADGTLDYSVAFLSAPVSTAQAADAQTKADTAKTGAEATASAALAVETAARIAADNLRILTSAKGVANGVASLDSGGRVPVGQIPLSAFSSVDVVANQAAMLALSVVEGALAIRTDTSETYVLATNSPSTLADWKLIDNGTSISSVSADVVFDGTTNHAFTAADDTKLAGIMSGATKVVFYEYNGATWDVATGEIRVFINRTGDGTTPPEGTGAGQFTDGRDIFLISLA
jgi:hypothetical protein